MCAKQSVQGEQKNGTYSLSRLQNRIICTQSPENMSMFLSIISIEDLVTYSNLQLGMV